MALSDPALATESALRREELGDADALVREAGWNQVSADWNIFLTLGSAYAVRNSDGRVIATAATLPHGGQFAWISMVLVNAQYRRQGLATRLLRRCIDDLTSSGLVSVLDATPEGREVYRHLGFQDSWGYHRLVLREGLRTASAPEHRTTAIYPIDHEAWNAICAYDAESFGANRSRMLCLLRGRLPQAELYAARDGRVTGFLLGRDGQRAAHLGPLIAEDYATALALLQGAFCSLTAPVSIDLADSQGEVRAWLEAAGFSATRPFTRMLLNRGGRFDDPKRTFAVVGPEFG
jgi:GNAT superfamily N-acetyltransferase